MIALAAGLAACTLTAVSLHVIAAPRPPGDSPSAAMFDQIAPVLQSPRCMNCHTSTSFPRQGDDRHPHRMNISRGPNDHGAPGLRCSTCHTAENHPASGVPGAPKWGLAPLSMAWEGLSVSALCTVLKARNKNGGRSVDALVRHMTGDPLVQWAWHPGAERAIPPMAQDPFHDLVRRWAASGADCPTTSVKGN